MNAAKAIIQSGIKEVIYDSDKYADTTSVKASKMMFDCAGSISSVSPDRAEKWKLNYKRYVEVPLDCEVQTVALFFS